MTYDHDRDRDKPSTVNVILRVDSDATERGLTAILNKLEALAAMVQQVKDAVAGINTQEIAKALGERATALEALASPQPPTNP